MAQEKSLADKLVFFMRKRDEAKAKIDALPREGDFWPPLSVLLDQQEQVAASALYEAAITADRLGRLAELSQAKKKA
jgi:hypothetical protein